MQHSRFDYVTEADAGWAQCPIRVNGKGETELCNPRDRALEDNVGCVTLTLWISGEKWQGFLEEVERAAYRIS